MRRCSPSPEISQRPAGHGLAAGCPLANSPCCGGSPREDLLYGVKPAGGWGARSADLVGPILLQDHVDAAQQLARDGAHGRAPWLALIESTLEIGGQVGVRTTGRDSCQPQRAAQVRRATFGHVRL